MIRLASVALVLCGILAACLAVLAFTLAHRIGG